MPALRPRFCCYGILCNALLAWLPVAAAQPAYTFTKIAESTGALRFAEPVVNNLGVVAYRTLSEEAIYKSAGGVTTKIADATGPFQFLSGLDINDAGAVVFKAQLDGTTDNAIYVGDGQSLTTIATFETENPLGGPFTFFGPPSLNAAGTVAFMGRAGQRRGVFASNGALSTVVDDAGPLHGFGADVSINDLGTVAFSGVFDDRPLVQGVFISNGGGAYTPIGESTFGMVASSLNNLGALVFQVNGSVAMNPHGDSIFVGSGGPTQTIAGSELNRYFADHPAINDAGVVAYENIIDASGVLPPGIYTGPDAAKVIQHGDPLFGSFVDAPPTSSNLSISSSSLNVSGQIAFIYVLANGGQGVALATPVPEPPSAAAAAMAVGLLGAIGARHSKSAANHR